MPYATVADLPETVRRHLPLHAQEIYRAAFNSAWEQYAHPTERRRGGSREAVAHRVAWAAVKKLYEKRGEHWVPRRR